MSLFVRAYGLARRAGITRRPWFDDVFTRAYFGDFDPFGDFDLLFGAARAGMQIVDVPVRYRARTYGDTKISRFAHGWMLLKMTAFGFQKLRMGSAAATGSRFTRPSLRVPYAPDGRADSRDRS